MTDIVDFPGEKARDYPHMDELSTRINTVIDEYAGEISTAEVIDILEMIKINLYLYSQDVDE